MVTVRLPRGFAVLLVGLFLSVILLAFWVGSTWGQRRAIQETQFETTLTALGGRSIPPPREIVGMSPTPIAVPPDPVAPPTSRNPAVPSATRGDVVRGGPVVVIQGAQRDARLAGLNYFTANLVGATQEEARAVVEFLWQEGVESQAIKLHNSRLFQLIALRGFAREELGTPACKAYERQLQQLGRQWRADARNPRKVDFSGIYPARYDTPQSQNQTVELVITRER